MITTIDTSTNEEFEVKIFNEIEYARLIGTFKDGIEWLDKLEKRLKRKKLLREDDTKFIEDIKNILSRKEMKYYKLFKMLLEEKDPNEVKEISEELSCMIYNKYGIINKMLEWELNERMK